MTGMKEWRQRITEKRFYSVFLLLNSGDSVVSATWRVVIGVGTLGVAINTTTESKSMFTPTQLGVCVIACEIVCASGQEIVGEHRINVIGEDE